MVFDTTHREQGVNVMTLQVLLTLWIASGLGTVFERRLYRLIIYFGIFSMISSLVYLFLGAPDVAMAEAGISAFTTMFFIIFLGGFYKYYAAIPRESRAQHPRKRYAFAKMLVTKMLLPVALIAGLFALFVYVMPANATPPYLKEKYLTMFMANVGGENAVAAILLSYRVYDTLFEALILVVAVVAVVHMSRFKENTVTDIPRSEIENSGMAVYTLRVICPLIVVFGIYLALNGHIAAGGGFQGGLAVASFFICRYMIYDIYDIRVSRVMLLEEMMFISIIILSAIAVFLGIYAYVPTAYLPIFQHTYLILMNIFIGLKVTCGFFILFYRYVIIEKS